MWALCIALTVICTTAGGFYLFAILSSPIFMQMLSETHADSRVPLAKRIDVWSTVLDQEADRLSRQNTPDANGLMAEKCNSCGWTLVDESQRKRWGRNNILVAVWMFRNAELYADEPPASEAKMHTKAFASNYIQGLIKDYALTEAELKLVEVATYKSPEGR